MIDYIFHTFIVYKMSPKLKEHNQLLLQISDFPLFIYKKEGD